MKQSQSFTSHDLLLNESFLNYYFQKNDADVWEWEEYLENYPNQQPTADEAIQTLKRLSLTWNEAQIRQKFGQFEVVRSTQTDDDTTPVMPLNSRYFGLRKRWGRVAIGVAASLVLVLGLWSVWQLKTYGVSPIYRQQIAHQELIERVNKTDKPQLVMLPDGSSILLQKNSRLSYPREFGADSRVVYLDGEAFFEVQKNPHKPFYVYADALVARVLGTSFAVNARASDPALRVVVRTGKVSVYRLDAQRQQPAAGGWVVTSNQQISLARETQAVTRSLVAEPQMLRQTHGFTFNYQDTPAATVFAQIEQAYGITLVYDEAQLQHCPVTASLLDEPLYEKLDLVCRAIEARYEVIDGQVVITGSCSE